MSAAFLTTKLHKKLLFFTILTNYAYTDVIFCVQTLFVRNMKIFQDKSFFQRKLAWKKVIFYILNFFVRSTFYFKNCCSLGYAKNFHYDPRNFVFLKKVAAWPLLRLSMWPHPLSRKSFILKSQTRFVTGILGNLDEKLGETTFVRWKIFAPKKHFKFNGLHSFVYDTFQRIWKRETFTR